jgi:hypothetical protein
MESTTRGVDWVEWNPPIHLIPAGSHIRLYALRQESWAGAGASAPARYWGGLYCTFLQLALP